MPDVESRVSELEERLATLRIQVAAWPAAILLIGALGIPVYKEVGEAPTAMHSLEGLASRAGKISIPEVQVFAIILFAALLICAIAVIVGAIDRHPRARIVIAAVAAVGLVACVPLFIAVSHYAGDGVGDGDGDLGYTSTIGVLLAPLGFALALVTAWALQEAET